jgi:hypothetical protein
MRRRITVSHRLIAGPRNDLAVADDGAADRHLTARLGGTGFLKSNLHK